MQHARPRAQKRNRWSWSLPSIAGIETRVHASFLLLLAWVAFSAHSSTGSWIGAAFGVAFVVTMFGAVLLHELGHALTARRYGIPTKAITLYPIGGVAELMGQARTPRQELLIALAGPAVNFVLAAVIGALIFFTGPTGIAGTFLSALAWANLGLGAFNLLPAFPMDGGRVLRAALTPRKGHLQATEIAAKLGKVGAVGLGIWGLFSNPWLILIAGVLWVVGDRELRYARLLHAARAQGYGGPMYASTPSGQYMRVEVLDGTRGPRRRAPSNADMQAQLQALFDAQNRRGPFGR